jgi:hypothetical protein
MIMAIARGSGATICDFNRPSSPLLFSHKGESLGVRLTPQYVIMRCTVANPEF